MKNLQGENQMNKLKQQWIVLYNTLVFMPRDKLLHIVSYATLAAFLIVISAPFVCPGLAIIAAMFIQAVQEYVIQPRQKGRTSRDWKDMVAGWYGALIVGIPALVVCLL